MSIFRLGTSLTISKDKETELIWTLMVVIMSRFYYCNNLCLVKSNIFCIGIILLLLWSILMLLEPLFFCYTPNLLARLPIKIRFKGGNHRNNEKRKLFKLIILVKVNTV